jgi:hypothetical protein
VPAHTQQSRCFTTPSIQPSDLARFSHAFHIAGNKFNSVEIAGRSRDHPGEATSARRDMAKTRAIDAAGASHMAEGYTRAKAGNIGVCIGTSGPAGTDMITGLYSAIADSIPVELNEILVDNLRLAADALASEQVRLTRSTLHSAPEQRMERATLQRKR